MIFTCPDCGAAAELAGVRITERADGPLHESKIRCSGEHPDYWMDTAEVLTHLYVTEYR